MAAGDLTTSAALKAYLGIGTEPLDAEQSGVIDRLITSSSTWFKQQVGCDILSATYTDTFNGTGGRLYTPKNYPVAAVSAVSIDGVSIPARVSVNDNGYSIQDDGIYLVGYSWACGVKNCSVAYTAGYAAIPADVEQAVIEKAAMDYKQKDRLGQMNRSINGESVTWQVLSIPISIQTVIDNYQRWNLG
jgi:hypothetical protein